MVNASREVAGDIAFAVEGGKGTAFVLCSRNFVKTVHKPFTL